MKRKHFVFLYAIPMLAGIMGIGFAEGASAKDTSFHAVLDQAAQLDQWAWRDNRDDAWFE